MQRKSPGFGLYLLGFLAVTWGCSGGTGTQPVQQLATGGVTASEGGSDGDAGESSTTGGRSATKTSARGTAGGTSSRTTATKGGSSSTAGGASAKGGSSNTASRGGSSAGGSSTTSTALMGPTPKSTTANFPFPQNRFRSACSYPTQFKNEDVLSVYEQWKADLVTSDGAGGYRRVKRPDEPGLKPDSTVSEGIAYGMLIAVYMDDQPLFDDLWRYALKYPSSVPWPGSGKTMLMDWYILADGTVNPGSEAAGDPGGGGAATDSDEDMAWALIMADRQWGGAGELDKSYLDYAKQLLADIWTHEILDSKLPKNGSGWGDWNNLNVSYFAPSYYRVFARVTGKTEWESSVVPTVYDVLEQNLSSEYGNQNNGLVRAFSTSTGGRVEGQKDWHQYDSCRTPFRFGLDACHNDVERARTYLGKITSFYAGIGAANIVDGYNLDGTEHPEPDTASRGYQGRSAAFIGPAAVGAMHDGKYQSFIDEAWELLRQNNLWHGGQYYDESWTILSMLMLSGNFLDYTAETPLDQ